MPESLRFFRRGGVLARRVLFVGVFIGTLVHPAWAFSADTWKHVNVVRRSGAVEARLSYEARSEVGGARLRRISLTVDQPGTPGLVRSLGGTALGDNGTVSLNLRNVWGGAALEVLVTVSSCGNRCDDRLYLALETAGTWHLISHDFGAFWPGPTAWTVRLARGRFEFVSSDTRFFCFFASCAGSAVPPQVFEIDRVGRSFVDVTRTRRDLVRADAAHQWGAYVSGRRRGQSSDYAIGTLAAWCADEYLLGLRVHCDELLERQRIDGYLDKIPGLSSQGFIRKLRHELTVWGYASR